MILRVVLVALLTSRGSLGAVPGFGKGLGSALLSADLMPPGLLMAESKIEQGLSPQLAVLEGAPTSNASVGFALSTMDFHRRMMNEYLCRGYMAEDILERLQRHASVGNEIFKGEQEDQPISYKRNKSPNNSKNSSSEFKHRRGGNMAGRRSGNHKSNQMLSDEGSSNYRDWLTRSAVLEDIYRRYEQVGDQDEGQDRQDDGRDDDYDGEITGWAMEEPMHHWPKQDNLRHPGEDGDLGDGYGHHGEYSADPIVASSSNSALSLGVRDIFDVALTAIAFLAFGIFILNVFLGILLPSSSTRTVVISNLTLPFRNRAGALDLSQEKQRRIARWAEDEDEPFEKLETVEETAARLALISLRSALDNTPSECLQVALCNGNKESRNLQGQAKYWLPIWSLGMSWLSRRGGGTPGSEPGSSALFSGALENLRAATLGLAGARCNELFPSC